MTEKRAEKHAVIYFEQGAAAAMKDLAGQIRGEGGKTTMIWASRWRDADDMLPEARAVIIQKGCHNEESIVEAYQKFGVDVEIHFVNEDGIGVAADDAHEETHPEPVQEEAASDSEAEATADVESDETPDDEPEGTDDPELPEDEGTDPGVDEEDRLEG